VAGIERFAVRRPIFAGAFDAPKGSPIFMPGVGDFPTGKGR
jgi:hypothetical protein